MSKKKLLVFFIGLICLFFIFFYKLSFKSLESYDEAWYAEISRNILISKNPLLLKYNGSNFTDHPPLAINLMALSQFVINQDSQHAELAVRFASAFCGLLSILLIIAIGKKIRGYDLGFASAAILLSFLWYMLRARSGNLDVMLIFWSLMSLYCALSIKAKNFFIYLLGVSLAGLLLTKTLVGVGILPSVGFVLWLKRKELSLKQIAISIAIFLALILPWYIYNQFIDSRFLYHHFFEIGARNKENSNSLEAVNQVLFYLCVGIGRWYKIFFISLLVMPVLFILQKKQRQNIIVLLLFFAGYFLPFAISSKTEIWHLLPTYPAVALILAFILLTVSSSFKWIGFKFITLILIFALAGMQFYQSVNLIYAKEKINSNEKNIALSAQKLTPLYLMDTFLPSAIFYSKQNISPLYWDKNANEKLLELLANDSEEYIIINKTTADRLGLQQIKFQIISENDSYLIIK